MTAGTLLAGTFWVGVCWTLYAYVGFPCVISVLAAARRRAATSVPPAQRPRDVVTVIIPAYNEEQSIEAKLRNILAGDYPQSLMDIMVVSDASTDRTDMIVRTFEREGIRLVVQDMRRGKTAGLNRALAAARGDIVVFTDANATYPPGTIRTLVQYFQTPTIGMVTGYTRYRTTQTGEVAEATNLYTSLERVIKRAESAWGCCVGADGAVFAMRRTLYRPLRDDDINDFVIPLNVIEQGYDCVMAEDAFCSEHPGKSLESEFRRQSRITNRTLRALYRNAHLLNPWRFPSFSFFLFSHKLVRFMVPLFLALSGLALLLLIPSGGMYAVAGIVAVLAVVLAALSAVESKLLGAWRPLGQLLRFVSVFLTINIAVLHGWWKFLSGRADVTWQHDRSPA